VGGWPSGLRHLIRNQKHRKVSAVRIRDRPFFDVSRCEAGRRVPRAQISARASFFLGESMHSWDSETEEHLHSKIVERPKTGPARQCLWDDIHEHDGLVRMGHLFYLARSVGHTMTSIQRTAALRALHEPIRCLFFDLSADERFAAKNWYDDELAVLTFTPTQREENLGVYLTKVICDEMDYILEVYETSKAKRKDFEQNGDPKFRHLSEVKAAK
jgi:hypothetical protein